MAGFGLGALPGLISSLISGSLDDVLEKKLETLGEDFIRDQLSGPFGLAQRAAAFVGTGGENEFDRLRNQWTNQFKGPSVPGFKFVDKLLQVLDPAQDKNSKAGNSKWGRSSWAQSRNDWLDNHWKHDWRSQPRDIHGRWVPGRLDAIPDSMKWAGVRPGRKTKLLRKRRRKSRSRGRQAAKKLIKQIGGR